MTHGGASLALRVEGAGEGDDDGDGGSEKREGEGRGEVGEEDNHIKRNSVLSVKGEKSEKKT